MRQACKYCRYFMPIERAKKGRFRRYPPSISPVWTGAHPVRFYTNYPAIYDDQWCGEYVEAQHEAS
ncbi:MAG: hypothetical protein CMM31_07645 [Rhodospirillaceae bacterium]|nr:hypothetical protein [Rhodospirillaceae bacterium]